MVEDGRLLSQVGCSVQCWVLKKKLTIEIDSSIWREEIHNRQRKGDLSSHSLVSTSSFRLPNVTDRYPPKNVSSSDYYYYLVWLHPEVYIQSNRTFNKIHNMQYVFNFVIHPWCCKTPHPRYISIDLWLFPTISLGCIQPEGHDTKWTPLLLLHYKYLRCSKNFLRYSTCTNAIKTNIIASSIVHCITVWNVTPANIRCLFSLSRIYSWWSDMVCNPVNSFELMVSKLVDNWSSGP